MNIEIEIEHTNCEGPIVGVSREIPQDAVCRNILIRQDGARNDRYYLALAKRLFKYSQQPKTVPEVQSVHVEWGFFDLADGTGTLLSIAHDPIMQADPFSRATSVE